VKTEPQEHTVEGSKRYFQLFVHRRSRWLHIRVVSQVVPTVNIDNTRAAAARVIARRIVSTKTWR
jgi:hypothetical protein